MNKAMNTVKKPRRKHAKWTLKKQSEQFFLFIQTMKSFARELDYIGKDDGCHEMIRISKEMLEECNDKLEYL